MAKVENGTPDFDEKKRSDEEVLEGLEMPLEGFEIPLENLDLPPQSAQVQTTGSEESAETPETQNGALGESTGNLETQLDGLEVEDLEELTEGRGRAFAKRRA